MKVTTQVNATYSHFVELHGHRITLTQALKELKSVIEGHPAAMQQPSMVTSMLSAGAVQAKPDKPKGANDAWLEAGPNAQDVLKQLNEAKLEALGHEEILTKAINEAVAAVDPEPDYQPSPGM
jgi:hypothetical protein